MELPKSGEDYLKKLRRRLRRAGISYGELARELGLETTQVSRWMNLRVTDLRVSTINELEAAVAAIARRKGVVAD